MRIKHWSLILFSGAIWFFIGVSLLTKGLRLLVYSQGPSEDIYTFKKTVLLYVTFALVIGFIKGRFVLLKRVEKIVKRILNLSQPISLLKVYSPSYLVVILLMMSLGFLMNILQIPGEIRGFIDVSIGSALLFGSLAFLRLSLLIRSS